MSLLKVTGTADRGTANQASRCNFFRFYQYPAGPLQNDAAVSIVVDGSLRERALFPADSVCADRRGGPGADSARGRLRGGLRRLGQFSGRGVGSRRNRSIEINRSRYGRSEQPATAVALQRIRCG